MGEVIHFSDALGLKLLLNLRDIQDKIHELGREMLAGKKHNGAPLTALLNEMDSVIDKLAKHASKIHNPELKALAVKIVKLHNLWSAAKIGSEEEKKLSVKYLEAVDLIG